MEEKPKFQIGDLLPIGMTLVVLTIGIAYGLNVVGDVKDNMGVDSCAGRSDGYVSFNATSQLCEASPSNGSTVTPSEAYYNSSVSGIKGVSNLTAKLPLIATVIVAAIVIGILLRYLYVRYSE